MFKPIVQAIFSNQATSLLCVDPHLLLKVNEAPDNYPRTWWLNEQKIDPSLRPPVEEALQRFRREQLSGREGIVVFRDNPASALQEAISGLRTDLTEVIGTEHPLLAGGDEVLWKGFWTYLYAGATKDGFFAEACQLFREEGGQIMVVSTHLPGEDEVVRELLEKEYKKVFVGHPPLVQFSGSEFVVIEDPILAGQIKEGFPKINFFDPAALRKIGEGWALSKQNAKQLSAFSLEWITWLRDYRLKEGLHALGGIEQAQIDSFQLKSEEELRDNGKRLLQEGLDKVMQGEASERRKGMDELLVELMKNFTGEHSRAYLATTPIVFRKIWDQFLAHLSDEQNAAAYQSLWQPGFEKNWNDLVALISSDDRTLAKEYAKGAYHVWDEALRLSRALKQGDDESHITEFVSSAMRYFRIVRLVIDFRLLMANGEKNHYLGLLHDPNKKVTPLEVKAQRVREGMWYLYGSRKPNDLSAKLESVATSDDVTEKAFEYHSQVCFYSRETGEKTVLPVELLSVEQQRYLEKAVHEWIVDGIKYQKEKAVDPCVTVETFQRSDWFEVVVTDNGPGMTEEQVAKLGEESVRYHPHVSEGTGWGLYDLLNDENRPKDWEIGVKSVIGQGTTWTLRIPLKKPTASPSS
jgi:anti-sigma regulatory factor (Ser/Thr protein kinase)